MGLAQKAGKIVSGDDAVLNAIEKHKAILVLIAMDASKNSKELLCKKARNAKVEYYVYGNKIGFGMAIGKSPRAAIAILDKNFAAGMKKVLEISSNS